MTRRALLRKGVDLGWAAGVVALTGSLASCSRGAETQRIAPLHADTVVTSYGIQLHSSFRDSVYSQYDEITKILEDLGARSVRDRLVTTVPESVLYLEQLGDRGISTLLTTSLIEGRRILTVWPCLASRAIPKFRTDVAVRPTGSSRHPNDPSDSPRHCLATTKSQISATRSGADYSSTLAIGVPLS